MFDKPEWTEIKSTTKGFRWWVLRNHVGIPLNANVTMKGSHIQVFLTVPEMCPDQESFTHWDFKMRGTLADALGSARVEAETLLTQELQKRVRKGQDAIRQLANWQELVEKK